jgi:hypothetical protein
MKTDTKTPSTEPEAKGGDGSNSSPTHCSTFINVPRGLAGCPECGGHISAEMDGGEIMLTCENEPPIDSNKRDFHKWHQDDWQPVIDRVRTLFDE